jgi:hypothetical protein
VREAEVLRREGQEGLQEVLLIFVEQPVAATAFAVL